MFRKLLIANRGEIACRVAATARRLGIATVAVYSDADVTAAHVQACDEALHIGASPATDSYLRGDRLIAAAKATGAQAIHPGYGFLSENADFAQACADAGLVFIGPPPAAIRAMGLKSESKRLMAQAGVPLVPGYHGADQDTVLLQREADAIGYPVLIKASAGGGGKGMRVVAAAADFAAALASCQREAQSSFGNGAVLIERFLTRPRHIEIQVFADTQGHCIHLFERDCSVQRRHQKVLEESPAPGLSAERRAQMGAAAVAAAIAVGYVGAGTVEFIAEPAPDGELNFYFMEMNTRLQVEHPVTEAVTGLDLVDWQLRIAAGEALPLQQHELRQEGHAIEARFCAENPDRDFMPATGALQVFRTPPVARFERAALRLDAGVREGDAVTPFYDPMIAKLIAWAPDRAQAVARLGDALARTHIVGVHTNVGFLRGVVASRAFSQADLDTALIERERAAWFEAAPLGLEWAAAAWVTSALQRESLSATDDPWSRGDAWRVQGLAPRHFNFEAHDAQHRVTLTCDASGATVSMGDRCWTFSTEMHDAEHHDVTLDGRCRPLTLYATPEGLTVFDPEGARIALRRVEHDSPAHAPSAGQLTAPMPGKLLALLVGVGQTVRQGQSLAVMEAMKMEHTITAPRDGVVQSLLHAVGDQVAEGAELLRLGAAGSAG